MKVGIVNNRSGVYENQLLTSNMHIRGRNCFKEELVFLRLNTSYFSRDSFTTELKKVKI